MGISNLTRRIRGPGLARMNFDTAVVFATECTKIGQRYDENPQGSKQITPELTRLSVLSRDYALGTVFASVAWLEAVINGVFLYAVESMPKDSRSRDSPKRVITCDEIKPKPFIQSLSPAVIKSMAQMWLQKKTIESWDDFPCLSGFLEKRDKDYYISKPKRDFCDSVKDWPTNIPRPDKNKIARYLNKRYPSQPFYRDIEYSWPTLDKYQLALYLNRKNYKMKKAVISKDRETNLFSYSEPFPRHHPKRKAVSTLIRFRHYLTHPKEDWYTTEAPKEEDIGPDNPKTVLVEREVKLLIESDPDRPSEGYLHEQLFSRDPDEQFFSQQFPFNCLMPGLSKMAVRSVYEFVDEFCRRMGITNVTKLHALLRPPLSVIYR
jgi:hypothetical protein